MAPGMAKMKLKDSILGLWLLWMSGGLFVLAGCTAQAGADVVDDDSGLRIGWQADVASRGSPEASEDAGWWPGLDLWTDYSAGEDGVAETPLECLESPYGFGCPCQGNDDCLSGYCVEGTDSYVCTETCMEDCPAGWNCKGLSSAGSDIVFLCVPTPKKLCFPCQKDEQCAGGRCVPMDGGQHCAMTCGDESGCPDGFECQDDDDVSLCLPRSGSCACLPGNEGDLKPCEEVNQVGTCYGYAECDPAAGWTACSAPAPVAEVCDGKDNDCDGLPDDDLPDSQPCQNQNLHGVCQGLAACLGPLGWVCQAPEPLPEQCDYADNNCNGFVDEGFVDVNGKYSHYLHCGTCAVSCALGFPNAKAKCDVSKPVPKCVVDVCDPGFYKLNDYQCIPNSASLCEPCTEDDNCLFEGAKCVALADGSFCAKACQSDQDCPAGYACQAYQDQLQCIPDTNSCTCTGDNLDLSKACSATWPPMPEPGEPHITCYGFQYCTELGWTSCDLPEESCDGLDNDCNGVADDPFVSDEGKYVTDQNCGQCGNNCTALNLANAKGICDDQKAVPDCKMQCKPAYHDVNSNPADGCECFFESDEDLPDGVDQNCDGVDGEILNALFVAKNGDDGNPGSLAQPLLTVSAAVLQAVATGKRDVYVATGVYTESVTLQPSVNLYGGYSSDFKVRHVLLYETVIMGVAPTPNQPGAVTIANVLHQSTTLDGFTIFGFDNDDPGQSSYAIYVRDCSDHLTIRDCHVLAGDGGDGDPGTNGDDGQDAPDGANGKKAYLYPGNSCNNWGEVAAGGKGGGKVCSGVSTAGGKGGGSFCASSGSSPQAGEHGQSGAGPRAGNGGSAGWDAIFIQACSTCTVPTETHPMDGADGLHGQDGTHGNSGAGCSAVQGSVLGGLWGPADGGTGQTGGHGGGGGGGGAGGGVETDWSLWCSEQIGGTGGGGGAGGCSGTGGSGAESGGGSFGLFLFFTAPPAVIPLIENNLIGGGQGGDGGHGGNGGTGGVGGTGGSGGTEDQGAWCARGGGNGGKGGNGGHGGGGGGGCGGLSYAIYAHGHGNAGVAAYENANDFFLGTGGLGGSGGPSIGNPGVKGTDGTSDATNF